MLIDLNTGDVWPLQCPPGKYADITYGRVSSSNSDAQILLKLNGEVMDKVFIGSQPFTWYGPDNQPFGGKRVDGKLEVVCVQGPVSLRCDYTFKSVR